MEFFDGDRDYQILAEDGKTWLKATVGDVMMWQITFGTVTYRHVSTDRQGITYVSKVITGQEDSNG